MAVPVFNRSRSSIPSTVIADPIESICMSMVPRRRALGVYHNASFIMELEEIFEPVTPVSGAQYGYLKHIQSYKPFCRTNDKSLPRKVRQFYAKQLELINSIEDILVPKTEQEINQTISFQQREQRAVRLLTMVNLIVNIILVIIKIIGAAVSRSLSVTSSVVNSITDVRTNLILIWAARCIKKRDPDKYPLGRTRLQTVSVIMLSIVMCAASVQVIIESGQRLSKDIKYFQKEHNDSSTAALPEIDMNTFSIIAMAISIASKALLFLFSYRNTHPSVIVLCADNRNDVITGIIVLTCGLIASNARDGDIKTEAVVLDPVGAIVISICVLLAWSINAYKYVRFLAGLTANPMILQRITHIVYNYRPDVVTDIHLVQAIHFGVNYFAYVEIGLSRSMPLAMAHDIGIELQNQLESMEGIERAFVSLNFTSSPKSIAAFHWN